MKLKKIAAAALSALLGTIIVFSGCNNQAATESSAEASTEASTEVSTEVSTESSAEASIESSAESSETDADYTPAMWKVTKDDKELYLFGSIHATQDGAENLPDYVQEAFDECDYLALELDVNNITSNLEQSLQLIQELMYTDGTTIKDHISEETYNAVEEYLTEHSLYSSYYDSFKPVMWISLLESAMYSDAGIDISNSMETIMTAKAEESGKEILEVETIETQLSVFDKISDELADVLLLSYTQADPEEQLEANNELYEKWKCGDVIEDTDDEEIPEEYKDDYEAYYKAMLTDRNEGMADEAEEYMNDGKKVFFMVGAAHMYGDDGIVQLLIDRGYTVERVYSQESSLSSAA